MIGEAVISNSGRTDYAYDGRTCLVLLIVHHHLYAFSTFPGWHSGYDP